MSCSVPLFLPDKFKAALRFLYDRGIPPIALEALASYLWSSEFACVASRDGYLRILFDGTCFVFERHLGPCAVWCLSFGWGNLYVSLYGGGVRAFTLSGNLQLRYNLRSSISFLCLCCTTTGVCAGSAHSTFYVFSPELILLQQVHLGWLGAWDGDCYLRQLNCCIPASGSVLLGSERGVLFRFADPSPSAAARVDVVKRYPNSAIFCLCFSANRSLLIAGLEHGADVVCAETFTSIFLVGFPESVWSISTRPGSDVVLLGLQSAGIVAVELDLEAIRRHIRTGTLSGDSLYMIQFRLFEMGTCMAISHALDGSWYAASNRSRVYFCSAAGTLSSRYVTIPVVEDGDHSGIPRRDIYDVLVLSGLSEELNL